MYHERLLPLDEEEGYPNQEALLQARQRKLEWLEQHDCQSCYYKGESEICLDHLRRLSVPLEALPRLTGTDKQVSWARKIRTQKLGEIVGRYQNFDRCVGEEISHGTVSLQEATKRRQWCQRSVRWVVARADAEWWIEHRALPGWELVRNAARLC